MTGLQLVNTEEAKEKCKEFNKNIMRKAFCNRMLFIREEDES